MNKTPAKEDYISRINKVIDYIDRNLTEELSLEKLAEIANFSPFHFHRIFSAIIGEPLNTFIQRLRLEKAACQLIVLPQKTITEIGLDCGFSGSSVFSRKFKSFFGVSPAEYRKNKSNNCKTDSKNCKTESKNWKEWEITSSYFGAVQFNQIWRIKMQNNQLAEVEVREQKEMTVAYIRYIGPYKGNPALFERLFTKLMNWAGPRGLINFPETKVLAVYHDDPAMTDETKLRTSACISVPENTEVSGEVGKMKIPGGKYAIGKFELANNEYPEAWDSMFGGWLPQSGYQPADGPCFESYLNDPKTHPQGKCIVEICIPVKPL